MEQFKDGELMNGKNTGSAATHKPDYGNWVSMRIIYGPAVVGFLFLIGAVVFALFGLNTLFIAIAALVAVLFFLMSLYFAYARYLFSPRGHNVQEQIRGLVISNLEWNGQGIALDIGCGNGAIAIKLARKYPMAKVTGIDYWGKGWEYSKNVCEKNAAMSGVGDRTAFHKASASKLPFEDESFDVVVSNLTFHEVRDTKDKRAVVKEALRVLKKGGVFVFQDLFLIKPAYGDIDDLVNTIKGWGIDDAKFIKTKDEPFIPRALKLPFMVGTMGIIAGKK